MNLLLLLTVCSCQWVRVRVGFTLTHEFIWWGHGNWTRFALAPSWQPKFWDVCLHVISQLLCFHRWRSWDKVVGRQLVYFRRTRGFMGRVLSAPQLQACPSKEQALHLNSAFMLHTYVIFGTGRDIKLRRKQTFLKGWATSQKNMTSI